MIIIGLLFLLIVPALGVGLVNDAGVAFLFFDEKETSQINTVSPYLMSLAMLLGVIFGSAYQALRAESEAHPWKSIKSAFQAPHLYRALLASPIVFIGVYSIASKNPDPVMALAFCFQNGFFCESVLQERKNH